LPYFCINSYSEKAAAQMGASFGTEDNLLNLNQSSPSNHGKAVLNLVFQAAELFSGMEEQVRETEARSQSISKDAAEKVKLAEKRAEAAERAQREVINETGRKLQDASSALKNAQARIEAAEDQLTALEFRAQSAEAQLHDAKQALLQVEEAIRERLLSEKPTGVEKQHDLAV
jgi:chromosome segregation ATPase